jgi:hypothetical protein
VGRPSLRLSLSASSPSDPRCLPAGDKGPLVLRGERRGEGEERRRGGEWVGWNLRKYNMLDVSLLQEEYVDTEHMGIWVQLNLKEMVI